MVTFVVFQLLFRGKLFGPETVKVWGHETDKVHMIFREYVLVLKFERVEFKMY